MKIQKFNEAENKYLNKNQIMNIDKTVKYLNDKFTIDINEYALYSQHINPAGLNHTNCLLVYSGPLSECLDKYKKFIDDNYYDDSFLFIVQRYTKSKYISEDELNVLLNADKYNL